MDLNRNDADDHNREEEEVPIVVDEPDSGSDRTVSDSESDSDSSANNDQASESDCESEMAESDPIDDGFGSFTRNGMTARENEATSDYKIVLNYFKTGMGSAAPVTEVVAMHRNKVAGATRPARFAAFKAFHQAVAEKLGSKDPNIRFAWYSGTKEDVSEILLHGFSSLHGDELGRIQLSGLWFALDQAMRVEPGDDGLRHMLYCRVIGGRMEQIPSGSNQVLPSSDEFDIGVDSLVHLRKYYVWSPYMNTHVCPAIVVSFKAPASLDGYVAGGCVGSTPAAASVAGASGTEGGAAKLKKAGPFGKVTPLVAALTRFLTPREMKIVVRLVDDFRAKKMTADDLKRKVRLIAGDRLVSALKLVSSTPGSFGGLQIENGAVRDIHLPGLIGVLQETLPAPKLDMIGKSLVEFRAKKIDRPQLAQTVRLIVGDDQVLIQAIKTYKIRKEQNNNSNV
ncbi:probable inactive poly [ADP-ribose] polymerase SRO3 [Argentina anserina]|uniref:probable inactive poly [ADP-ribose] polymerase SRO3 n=1 Tax=Argentina anserina TaxID=57926 RepID=UPI0021764192|nr:probable inactive poly [ADP-ribose] polymerase SRO3 [Potentilla anserina]